ncbi:MAG: septum formation protein Maf [Rikenellaceae bacterium]|nr:septum formation protein Maf [Rikenellaceae bacterium]
MLVHERLKGRRLILASRSPRRRELMAGCGLDFELAPDYAVEEVYPASLPAAEVPLYLASLKSEGYPLALAGDEILVTADTVVVLGGRILGKPHDQAEAVEMLRALSGRRHTVITGVVLRSADRREEFSVSTDVWFSPLDEETIDYYVERFRPLDKAGSYGIQEWIGYVGIERIDGSFYNVMGLPVQRLWARLGRFAE